MKFLKSWLQDYIVETLPTDAVIIDALNRKAFEVEEVIAIEDDTVFDIKVLPNRAHDALGHHGMAYELCASLGLTFDTSKEVAENRDFYDSSIGAPLVAIDDAVACTRFMSMRIDHVSVEESPLWLKKRLEAIGQRSINNIVDITNYVQFALNKPMHAYDARSIKGTLRARFAHAGETLTTLDDKELTLDEKTHPVEELLLN
jgi:phenylalanyl-tRNA synthetase beta chain